MINSTDEALALLWGTGASEVDRLTAITYLRNHPSPEGLEALVVALEDDDFAVNEAAGTALAILGGRAVPTLLKKLASAPAGARLRDGARKVLYSNASPLVRAESAEVVDAMKSPDADSATMEAARKLLKELE